MSHVENHLTNLPSVTFMTPNALWIILKKSLRYWDFYHIELAWSCRSYRGILATLCD